MDLLSVGSYVRTCKPPFFPREILKRTLSIISPFPAMFCVFTSIPYTNVYRSGPLPHMAGLLMRGFYLHSDIDEHDRLAIEQPPQ